MTPTWQTITADDLSSCWLEYGVEPHLFAVVRASEREFGFVAKLINSERGIAFESPTVLSLVIAKEMGVAMLEQYLFDLASEAMTLAGAR